MNIVKLEDVNVEKAVKIVNVTKRKDLKFVKTLDREACKS